MIIQPRPQHVRPGQGANFTALRILMLTTIPGNTFKTPAPHKPYTLPDADQAFRTALLSIYFPMKAESTYIPKFTEPPPYMELWALDADEAEIFKIVETLVFYGLNYDNDDPGVPVSVSSQSYWEDRTLYGNNYWAEHVGENVQDLLYIDPEFGTQVDRVITAEMSICGFKAQMNLGANTGTITPPNPLVGIIQYLRTS